MSPLGEFNVVLGRAIPRSNKGLKLLISVFEHLDGFLWRGFPSWWRSQTTGYPNLPWRIPNGADVPSTSPYACRESVLQDRSQAPILTHSILASFLLEIIPLSKPIIV
jgi:hypothetical protein